MTYTGIPYQMKQGKQFPYQVEQPNRPRDAGPGLNFGPKLGSIDKRQKQVDAAAQLI